MPKYLEYAFNCLPSGVNTEKARLQKRVLKWNYINGWKFGLACVKRALEEAEKDAKLGEDKYELPGIFYEAINLGEAHMTYWSNNGQDENYEILKDKYKKDSGDLGPRNLFFPENIVIREINGWAQKNYNKMLTPLTCGLDTVLDGVQPWKAAGDARVQMAVFKKQQFNRNYYIPSVVEANETSERIYYAFMKEEMDWQVKYLIDLFDE